MKRNLIFNIVFMAGVLIFFNNTQALALEEVIFTNGDRLSGEIVAFSGDTFEIETSFGKISVPKANLQKITFNPAVIGSNSSRSIITPDDLISFIQNSKLNFYVDSEKVSANNFANQVRVRWAMNYASVRELDEFSEKLVMYSPRTGAHVMVEVAKGKKVKACDWLDSALKSTKPAVEKNRKRNENADNEDKKDGNDRSETKIIPGVKRR